MTRKLMLPVLAVCAFAVVSVPAAHGAKKLPPKVAQTIGIVQGHAKAFIAVFNDIAGIKAAIDRIDDANKEVGERITTVDTRVTNVVSGVTSAAAQLQAGIVSLGQATGAAAGTANPNTAGAKTTETSSLPAVDLSTLSAGTTYRQFVLIGDTAAFPSPFGGATQTALIAGLVAGGLAELPLGVRTWVKMPDVNSASLGGDFYKNTWTCVSGRTATAARALLVGSLSGSVGGASNAGLIADAVATCP